MSQACLTLRTPCGPFWAILAGPWVVASGFGGPDIGLPEVAADAPTAGLLRDGVEAWAVGDERLLRRVPVLDAGRPFHKRVMQAVGAIPLGTTVTYAEVAASIGQRSAARAVGQALARNPCLLIVPCHRVVGGRGLSGYAGGPSLKARLLAHEAQVSRGAP